MRVMNHYAAFTDAGVPSPARTDPADGMVAIQNPRPFGKDLGVELYLEVKEPQGL
jgi:hypothetical protein